MHSQDIHPRARDIVQFVGHLPGMCKDLGSRSALQKKIIVIIVFSILIPNTQHSPYFHDFSIQVS